MTADRMIGGAGSSPMSLCPRFMRTGSAVAIRHWTPHSARYPWATTPSRRARAISSARARKQAGHRFGVLPEEFWRDAEGAYEVSKLATFGPFAAAALVVASCSRNPGPLITQEELMRRAQAIVDAVATGDRRPFEKYYAADSLIVDETGHIMEKKAVVA